MFHFLFIRSGVFDSVFAKFAKVLAKEISGCHRRNGVFQISLYSVIFCRQDILISWLIINQSFIYFKLQFVYHLNAHNRILYVLCNILRWSCFCVCFLPQEFLLEGPRFSTPEILLYFSLHFNTWMVNHPSANHGSSCLTAVSLPELVFQTWFCRRRILKEFEPMRVRATASPLPALT